MNSVDLLTPVSGNERPSRTRQPSQALHDRVVQSAANEAELSKKLGKKTNKQGKENHLTTVDERRAQSRAQISIEDVVPRNNNGMHKTRAPGALSAVVRQTIKASQAANPVPTTSAPATPMTVTPVTADTTARTTGSSPTGPTTVSDRSARARPALSYHQPATDEALECASHARGGDLPCTERLFVECAYLVVRSLESINPFTAKSANDTKVNNAIVYSRRAEPADKDLPVTDSMRQLIAAWFHQRHGDVKSAAQNIFAPHYGLTSSRNRGVIKKNKDTAKLLLTGDGFVYKNFKEREGMWQHPAISDCISAVWFSSRNKEGPRFEKVFNNNGEGIMLETIAFVATALYNCAKEWATGTRQCIQFQEVTFRTDYADLLKSLCDYAKANPGLVLKLRCKFYKAGMCAHAGVTVDTSTRSGLTAADIACAAAMDTISDDSDDGDDLGDDNDQHDGDLNVVGPGDRGQSQVDDSTQLELPADKEQVQDPLPEDEDDDAGPRRAKCGSATAVPEHDEDDAVGDDRGELATVQELEQRMSARDHKAYLMMTDEERDVYLEMTPEHREIFLGMSPEERAEWMDDADTDKDEDGDAAAVSSPRGRRTVTFDVTGEDEMSTSSELD
ncbi:hypothetical protein AURDEDRAFT_171159 [Auricularia subglabra TFB-10046 SS5]|uniref:DUF6532 domain-containing protein n=1 Tax=Auricularia subglabra (strain TFB-10046 / SS5) TaxID=717982 RepID=J0D1J5_AURST|nr:hypothetical protein AURDEDRAFT_171159 [Auricularia subglabra TFB-10046 SS5]